MSAAVMTRTRSKPRTLSPSNPFDSCGYPPLQAGGADLSGVGTVQENRSFIERERHTRFDGTVSSCRR